jgi:histidinol-phosphate aminotransferase
MTETHIVKLSANENCYGCSPLALEAGLEKFESICRYPDVNPLALKKKLADKYNVDVKNIVVGAGSVRIIDGLIQTFAGEGEEILTFEKSFIAYGELSAFHRRKCRFAPLTDFHCRLQNLYPYIDQHTRLIFIANPNNPTGTIISHDDLDKFLGTVPANITVVIDEAYAEYVNAPSFPDSFELQRKHPNLVILRSFSKIYGLAGLRIGYAIMSEQKSLRMSLMQIPFSVNNCAANAAIAALDDEDFTSQSARHNAEQRDFLKGELARLGYKAIQSHANFICVRFDSQIEKMKMKNLLLRNSILICDLDDFGYQLALRITIGKRQTNRKIISILSDARSRELSETLPA